MRKTNDKGKKCLKLTESTVRTFPLKLYKNMPENILLFFKKMRSVMYQNVCPPRLSSAEGLGCVNLFFFPFSKNKNPGGKLKKEEKKSFIKENICGI